jgi:hypothetical protein
VFVSFEHPQNTGKKAVPPFAPQIIRELSGLELPFTVDPLPRASLLIRSLAAARRFRPRAIDVWRAFHYADDYTEGLIARLAGARWLYTKKNVS